MDALNEILLFRSLFKGREDVFAVRWEKDNKSGYMPAYYYDQRSYQIHKASGGSFKDFKDKSYLRLTDEQIRKHLNGRQHIGLYPLLEDNKSWFIVADFDEENWIGDCRTFLNICREQNLPAYLERSRSGNGGHVWIFFNQAYPAVKSRHIILSLLIESGIISGFDKGASFDRLFPNQDFHSGKGFGNLIALPLFGTALSEGNSCFLDEDTLIPFVDQWQFLESVERASTEQLEELFSLRHQETKGVISNENSELTITLSSRLQLNLQAINSALRTFLMEELNLFNSEFIIKKNSGRSTFGTSRFLRFIEEGANFVYIPKGFTGRLLRFCIERNISYTFQDERIRVPVKQPQLLTSIRDYQKSAILSSRKKDIGVIVAPPGSGKTIIALSIVAEKNEKTLIIVHRRQLVEQWTERIGTFLGLSPKQIGIIGQGKVKVGDQITIATIQSLSKTVDSDSGSLVSSFGLIIVDECHHVPAVSFRNTISKFNSFYLYGLTATPFRKYNDQAIFLYLGDVISEIRAADCPNNSHPKIIIRNTSLNVPYNEKTDPFENLSRILIHDSTRNRMILSDVEQELGAGKKVVILTERRDHINTLYQYLKQSYESITLCGDDSNASRKRKWEVLKAGSFQILITTGQFFGEGSDLHSTSCLFLAYPFSFEGKLIQYIGRVQRSEIAPTIYDYRDAEIGYLEKMFLKRNIYYRKLEKQRTLFDLPEDSEAAAHGKSDIIIEKEINVKIQSLDFQFGAVGFKYRLSQPQIDTSFIIENWDLRPEFEVLKPYFEKYLKSSTIKVQIIMVLHGKDIVAQSATSESIAKLNSAVIESVRFQFVDKMFFRKSNVSKSTVGLQQKLTNGSEILPLYESGENLLETVLSCEHTYRHSRHLRYLSGLHEVNTLKIRFVLSPFAFVFLLAGHLQYHIVMETLDTDEATYLWHVAKSVAALKDALLLVDQHLGKIRNEGRLEFLKSNPENFSRILHDYSDERKGFVNWKCALEEKLV
jgi:superfamily II DNA or RNA helicase